MADKSIRTTANETFTEAESVEMARLVFKRFGRDLPAASAAWRRLLQNSCPEHMFAALVDSYPTACAIDEGAA